MSALYGTLSNAAAPNDFRVFQIQVKRTMGIKHTNTKLIKRESHRSQNLTGKEADMVEIRIIVSNQTKVFYAGKEIKFEHLKFCESVCLYAEHQEVYRHLKGH